MRLQPIDRPPTLLLRIACWLSRRQLGKVMMPLRVIYPRIPRLARAQYGMLKLSETGLSLPPRLRLLVESWVSMVNGCTFCGDLHQAIGLKAGLPEQLFRSLPRFRSDPAFSAAERAALAAAEEIARKRAMDDTTFEELRRHFDETQIAELVWLTAFVGYLNTMSVALQIGSDGFCAPPRFAPPEALPMRNAG